MIREGGGKAPYPNKFGPYPILVQLVLHVLDTILSRKKY
jgi:hypothetical protein